MYRAMYRPPEWKNPYAPDLGGCQHGAIFEYGADAMVEQLLASPDSYAPDSLILRDKLKAHKFGKGRLVFIPEEG